MADKKPERIYDVVVFGATGFTGRLVADYLAEKTGGSADSPTIRWAIAGRSQDRLAAIKQELAARHPACASVGLLTAELHDWATLVSMAQKTRVVLTTVGPFVDSGDKLVHACIAGEADYVDITGEPEFVDAVVRRFDEQARDKGVRIVNCCGFDSIPPDLGVWYTVKQLPDDVPIEVEGFVTFKGGVSGGTWHSAVTAASRLRETRKKRAAARAAGASRTGETGGRRVHAIKPRVRYHRQLGGWVYPLPTIDASVVRRSARALDEYGPSFGYAHYGFSRRLSSVVKLGLGAGALVALAQFGPTRQLLLDRKPAGTGPSAERRKKSRFEIRFLARAGKATVQTRVWGGDPGYDETAKMVAESALCLAFDRNRLPAATGVITPAVAMGPVIIERLERAGIGFEVVETTSA